MTLTSEHHALITVLRPSTGEHETLALPCPVDAEIAEVLRPFSGFALEATPQDDEPAAKTRTPRRAK